MKIRLLQIVLLFLLINKSFAQLGIKEINAIPNDKAMLDVESPNKGILIPRMNTVVRDGITSPPDGLMIYNFLTRKFNYFNNTIWQDALFGNLWASNSPNISYSTGFVGIGIPTPTRNLVLSSLGSPDILIQQSVFTGNTNTDGFLLGTNTNLDGEIWNFEGAGIKFGTSNSQRMSMLLNGNIGINDESPSEKLEVVGNIKASGTLFLSDTSEVNRTSTGAANMIPIAYGNVSAAGVVLTGTRNFTVVRLGVGVYEITVPGENITTSSYIFSAVPLSANPQVATVRANGFLMVETFEVSTLNQDSAFSFFLYKL